MFPNGKGAGLNPLTDSPTAGLPMSKASKLQQPQVNAKWPQVEDCGYTVQLQDLNVLKYMNVKRDATEKELYGVCSVNFP